MSFLKLSPQISVPPSEPKALTSCSWPNSLSIGQSRLEEMQRDLAEHEQPDVVAFLPSDQSISVEVMGYASPILVTHDGRKLEDFFSILLKRGW